MNKEINGCGPINIRAPKLDDLRSIHSVICASGPYLSTHHSYIFSAHIYNHWQTSAVAELNGELVGWLGATQVAHGKYFINQLGVLPCARRHKVAASLLTDFVSKLKEQPAFQVEYTISEGNLPSSQLFKSIAAQEGLQLQKRPEILPVLEEDAREQLYVMTWQANDPAGMQSVPLSCSWMEGAA